VIPPSLFHAALLFRVTATARAAFRHAFRLGIRFFGCRRGYIFGFFSFHGAAPFI
jgi:hypothetical protein